MIYRTNLPAHALIQTTMVPEAQKLAYGPLATARGSFPFLSGQISRRWILRNRQRNVTLGA